MLLVYSSNITPRIRYIFNFILGEICGFNYRITDQENEYILFAGPSLNYSNKTLKEREIRFKPSYLLFDNTIEQLTPVIEEEEGKIVFLFLSENMVDMVQDHFAAAFYLVSRYEEYLEFTPDVFGRFEANASIIYKFGILNKPLVNEWAAVIKNQILQVFPTISTKDRRFTPLITIDIDQAYAFRNRGFIRNLLTFLSNLVNFKMHWLRAQLQTILLGIKDPYDSYEYLKKVQLTSGLHFLYFINMGKYSKFDKNLNKQNKSLKRLIEGLKSYASIGLHPSFYSNCEPFKFKEEKESLQCLSDIYITKSRQHYLKLFFPSTYQNLIKVGIHEDYSMGYASQPGFRAGTCTPFIWFDLEKNCETSLKVFPITFMEGTFAEDLILSPSESLAMMDELIGIVKKHNGFLVTVWHNHTVNDLFSWKGWKFVFERMIENLKS